MKRSLVLLLLTLMLAVAASAQTTLNNNGCSCSSYQGAYLPVTNGGDVAYIHMNPFASPAYFETLDANFNVLQEWTDFVVVHPPSAKEPYLNASFGLKPDGTHNYTHQTFTPHYYRSGYILFFAGGTSTPNPLQ